ncbi:PREDICTED: LEM domain-containing protein 1 isoform X4 [Propithecus coquereli]|uniref:LEM domain containing 1 n=1 Tax=Propithecus coquereli TaxID=379532 RepID=A0A2K6EQH3_PROCO|nr:PREDICTED: LEM domain-containing protein 1 isoform X4 [Propithecus coquereli]
MVDVKCLKDCELQSHLEKLGYSPGPILRVLQEHQASESKTGLSTKRKTTARWTGARGAAEKASQWA